MTKPDLATMNSKGIDSSKNGFMGPKLLYGLVAALLVTSFGILIFIVFRQPALPANERLESALQLLQQGDRAKALAIVKSVDASKLGAEEQSKLDFVLGADARLNATSTSHPPTAFSQNEQAVAHLEKSHANEFPSGYDAVGNYHLGMALYDLYRWDEAEPPLQQAADRWPAGRVDAIERLIDIDLSSEHPNVPRAKKRVEHWKTLPASTPDDRARADLKEMQIALREENVQAIYELIDRIPAESPYRGAAETVVGQAHVMESRHAESSQDKTDHLNQAIDYFQRAIKSTQSSAAVKRVASLEQARSLRSLGKLDEAISALSTLRLSAPYTPESLAAGVAEIETLIEAGREVEAPAILDHITSNMGDPRWYASNAVSLPVLRNEIMDSGQKLIERKRFPSAARFAKSLPAFCEPFDETRLESPLYELWSDNSPTNSSERRKYARLAAIGYEKLLNALGQSSEYDDWLWRSITNYRTAGAYNDSNRLLERYLSQQTRHNRPIGHFTKAQNLASLRKDDDAIASYSNILHSDVSTPLVYQSKLEIAKIKSEKEDFDQANALLMECLNGEISPEHPVWREALLMLAKNEYVVGDRGLKDAFSGMESNPSQTLRIAPVAEANYQILLESLDRSKEFLQRYPEDDRQIELRYQVAQGARMAAQWPGFQLKEALVTHASQIDRLTGERSKLLDLARQEYGQIRRLTRSTIPTIPNERSVDPTRQRELLRNSLFSEADLYFDEGNYQEASLLYLEGVHEFTNQPEALEARKQLAICQKQLGQLPAALRTLELAVQNVDQIPAAESARFLEVTPHDRAGWKRYLESLQTEWTSQSVTN